MLGITEERLEIMKMEMNTAKMQIEQNERDKDEMHVATESNDPPIAR